MSRSWLVGGCVIALVGCAEADILEIVTADALEVLDEDTPTTVELAAFVTGRADPPTFEVRLEPAHGLLEQVEDEVWQYLPDANYAGRDEAVWQASLGGVRDNAVLTFDVRPINDAPVAAPGQAWSTNEDEPVSGTLLATDVDGPDEILTFSLVSGPSHGRVDLEPDGRFSYTPDPNTFGPDGFSWSAVDRDNATTGPVAVDIDVAPVEDPLPLPPTHYLLSAGTTLEVPLDDIDVDGNLLTWRILEPPSNGNLAFVDSPLRLLYTPDGDFRGAESFTIDVTDGQETSPPARFTVTVAK